MKKFVSKINCCSSSSKYATRFGPKSARKCCKLIIKLKSFFKRFKLKKRSRSRSPDSFVSRETNRILVENPFDGRNSTVSFNKYPMMSERNPLVQRSSIEKDPVERNLVDRNPRASVNASVERNRRMSAYVPVERHPVQRDPVQRNPDVINPRVSVNASAERNPKMSVNNATERNTKASVNTPVKRASKAPVNIPIKKSSNKRVSYLTKKNDRVDREVAEDDGSKIEVEADELVEYITTSLSASTL